MEPHGSNNRPDEQPDNVHVSRQRTLPASSDHCGHRGPAVNCDRLRCRRRVRFQASPGSRGLGWTRATARIPPAASHVCWASPSAGTVICDASSCRVNARCGYGKTSTQRSGPAVAAAARRAPAHTHCDLRTGKQARTHCMGCHAQWYRISAPVPHLSTSECPDRNFPPQLAQLNSMAQTTTRRFPKPVWTFGSQHVAQLIGMGACNYIMQARSGSKRITTGRIDKRESSTATSPRLRFAGGP
ncbi:hypothetical protein BN2476_940038 [Paraburkholderia piptadeniae]|uniref:Uncharacterized protein n=1 Tax=Paraburkholderia piptadeniae TaxID=1701573 RepID=A0A1N7STJ5_9BURK|nr:hypothetical protein BN2476_940038 [Paraburkholderia piptadeniae]